MSDETTMDDKQFFGPAPDEVLEVNPSAEELFDTDE